MSLVFRPTSTSTPDGCNVDRFSATNAPVGPCNADRDSTRTGQRQGKYEHGRPCMARDQKADETKKQPGGGGSVPVTWEAAHHQDGQQAADDKQPTNCIANFSFHSPSQGGPPPLLLRQGLPDGRRNRPALRLWGQADSRARSSMQGPDFTQTSVFENLCREPTYPKVRAM